MTGQLFRPLAHGSAKWQCTVCGRTGYPEGRWLVQCLRGHAPCPDGCGRWLTLSPLGHPRRHPHHPDATPRLVR